ncbi:hypothetical protein [Bradyrhizobium sp. CB2312]|uniref:hypothetical protein n=1 Tax=Bradyrhizobium sp. CB2312 TaxID=3039155 RepID=UPI0024B1DF51|nr:hypothetical protein [Bradyrhizobium sp. CB2312]WFU69180.1 hypothetical protein QA642_28185 [Bradyrhizobium sp. CB2312]
MPIQIQMKYDVLVFAALATFLLVFAISAFVSLLTRDQGDLETRKIRFAAVTFTGILMLFVFTAIPYFVEPNGPGKEIFERAVTAMTPLAGAIIGYMFASRPAAGAATEQREQSSPVTASQPQTIGTAQPPPLVTAP